MRWRGQAVLGARGLANSPIRVMTAVFDEVNNSAGGLMGFCCKTFLFAFAFLVGSGVLSASSFSLTASASVGGEEVGTANCSTTGPASAGCSKSYSIPFGQGSENFGGTASATATFGDLHAGASAFGGCPGIDGPYNCFEERGAVSQALAAFTDSFALSGSPTKGYLDFTIVAEGTISETCGGIYASTLCDGNRILQPRITVGDNGADGQILINGVATGALVLANGQSVLNVLVPYDTGLQPPSVTLSLQTYDDCGYADESTCATSVDFLDTAYVSGLSVLDSNGNAVQGASIAAASGTDYNAINVVAPEPSTWLLFMIGACLTMPRWLRLQRWRC